MDSENELKTILNFSKQPYLNKNRIKEVIQKIANFLPFLMKSFAHF